LLALLVLYFCADGHLHWTALLFPLVIFPFLLLTMGFSWLLASLGVYLRDVGQVVGIFTTVLMFTCPIFYPPSALPESARFYLVFNPLTVPVEQVRAILLWGDLPDWASLGAYLCVSVVVAWLGFLWFQKTRHGFADVI
jgi:lipopolysaccharide transport system permease protein